MSTLDRAAMRCVNDFLERAGGSRTVALDLWEEELRTYPSRSGAWGALIFAVDCAFEELCGTTPTR